MNQRSICGLGLFAAFFALGCSDSGGDGGGGAGGTGGGSKSTGGASSTGGTSGAQSCVLGMDTARASTSAADSCCLLCVKEDPCNPGSMLNDCAGDNGYRGCDTISSAPAACAAATKAWYDCLRAEPDVCNPTAACDDESETATTVCNP